MLKHIRSSATFHHRIARTSGIQLNPRKIISILFHKNFGSFNQRFRVSSVDLSNGLLLWSSHQMPHNLARIDDKAISIHKFSPELQFIIRILILFKNLTGNKASRTVSNSIHRCKAEFHYFKKENKTELSLRKDSEKSKRTFVIKSFDNVLKFVIN